MTEIHDLIGPKPPEVVSPQFPTPWHSFDGFIYDANDGGVARVETETNQVPNSLDARTWVAQFIAGAVNEKIARDATQARYRAAWEKYRDDPTFTFVPAEDSYGSEEDHVQEREVFEQAKRGKIAEAEEAWINATEPTPAIQAFVDEIRAARYRSDVEYWRSSANDSFYRLPAQAVALGGSQVDAYYTWTGRVGGPLENNYLEEEHVRESHIPCTVLDVPEEFRL